MADGIASASIAVFGAVALAYATQFVADDFRRFREGSVLAAGLAGELSSYKFAVPILREMVGSWIAAIDGGRRTDLRFHPFDKPVDHVFPQAVSKLGLLGSSLVEEVVFVYGNLGAFRVAMEIISKKNADMGDSELRQRCLGCLQALERAAGGGEALVPKLQARSTQTFRPPGPWQRSA
ncbi:hypothetical protein WKW79_35610 [Variovorax robiniae]|uniref:Uncharacterized protein n=1 Tax=Variovorax robiniae TaxID=1836199 RepID=A0ABU8XJ74_9BURK